MSCFGGTDESLYLAELLVDKLKLTPDKIQDVGDKPLVISIKFIDFPIIQISQHEFHFAISTIKEDNAFEFNSGQTLLFSEKPRDLVKAIQQNPLKIYVFRHGDTFPTAETEVSLSGCLCNQIMMAGNDDNSLPKPFIMNGCFNLIDPGENHAGTIFFEFRLSCFGKFITNQYYVQSKNIFFQNKRSDCEMCVERISASDLYLENGKQFNNNNNEGELEQNTESDYSPEVEITTANTNITPETITSQ